MSQPFRPPDNCYRIVDGVRLLDIMYNGTLTIYTLLFEDGSRETVDGDTPDGARIAVGEWLLENMRIVTYR